MSRIAADANRRPGVTQAGGAGEEAGGCPQLEKLFTARREAGWAEFFAGCGKHEAELDGEAARWLKQAGEALQRFAEQVCAARERPAEEPG